jgi:hypothetical protein
VKKGENMTRKEFIRHMGVFACSSLAISLSFWSCSRKEDQSDATVEKETKLDPCEDLSQLSQEDLEIRENFEYVANTPIPGERCDNCELWIAPEKSEKCGGCQIMNGPIKPEGYCTAWVAMEND